MTCYLIREGNEPVALVASIDLACEIMLCQPPGYYMVHEIQVDALASGPRARAGTRSTRHSGGGQRDGPRMRSGQKIHACHRVGIQTDP
jgi:hypothetical protein